jgi:hypothetical protein
MGEKTMNMKDRLTFTKIMGDEESELFEISITSRNNEYPSGFWARDAKTYYCDDLGIEHCDTYAEFKLEVSKRI